MQRVGRVDAERIDAGGGVAAGERVDGQTVHVAGSRDAILVRTLADGPILPDPMPSFDDLAVALLPNLNVSSPAR